MKLAALSMSIAIGALIPVAHADENSAPAASTLLGVTAFETTYCPHVKVDRAVVDKALAATGANMGRDGEAIAFGAVQTTDTLHAAGDDAGQCAKFWVLFGPGGSMIPGLLTH